MKHATSRELYDYWNRIRGREAAPERSAIEPGEIRRILPDTFILEVVDRNRYLFRLAGTRICAAYCREIKGSDFLDLWEATDRQAMATLAAAVSSDAAAAVLTLEGRTARGHELAAELLLLPLRHGGLAYDRIIGSCAVLDRPYWFGAQPIVRQTIVALRLIWPDERPHFMRRASDRPQPPPVPMPCLDGNPRRRGHLLVVDGGKNLPPAP